MQEKENNFNHNLNFYNVRKINSCEQLSDFSDVHKKNKNAQVSIFIILAIIIFAVFLVLFFIFRDNIFQESVPAEVSPVYSYYLSCVEEEARNGINIIGSQGGYIDNPAFSPGSFYMPFSSQLGLVGIGIPYWYYISGNGLIKEQIPSKQKMEQELNTFLKDRINNCDFSEFRERGFDVNISNSEIRTTISEDRIDLIVNQDISIGFGDLTWNKVNHNVNVNSNLGKLYDISFEIYKKEKNDAFLENYGVDVLRLYAPVDGSEISCSPKIWETNNIRNELLTALEGNVPAMKIRGNYYNLNEEQNKYFVSDIDQNIGDVNVNFLFSRSWPNKIDVYPNDGEILRADPIGLQEGLGALGFCYVPYHFVYDVYYPVLIQVYTNDEIFQFPVVVSIDKNKPRESVGVESPPGVVSELCEYKNTRISVYTYNNNLEPINADISFKCFDTTCGIGTTTLKENDAVLIDNFPQCINGSIIAESEGYETTKFRISSLNQSSAVIVMKKIYDLDFEVRNSNEIIDGKGEYALISFTKDNTTQTFSYPEQKEISLSEGQYQVKVYVYKDSNISISGTTTEKCIDVPKSGFLGIFGATDEKCFDLDIPGQVLSYAVYGGGKENYYLSESELENSNKLSINSEGFSLPRKIEDLQLNYNRVENSGLDITLI